MAERHELDKTTSLLYLHEVKKIPSNSDRTRVLLATLKEDTIALEDEGVRDYSLDVIEQISSSSDFRKVMRAFLDKTRG